MLYLLDSTVLIDYLRGRPVIARVDGLRSTGDTVATTAINVEEIVRGLRTSELETVRRFFEGMLILPIGRSEGWQAGEWRRSFAVRGKTLSQADCLIAAAAAAHKAILATGNPGDFPMRGVQVLHWPVAG